MLWSGKEVLSLLDTTSVMLARRGGSVSGSEEFTVLIQHNSDSAKFGSAFLGCDDLGVRVLLSSGSLT